MYYILAGKISQNEFCLLFKSTYNLGKSEFLNMGYVAFCLNLTKPNLGVKKEFPDVGYTLFILYKFMRLKFPKFKEYFKNKAVHGLENNIILWGADL